MNWARRLKRVFGIQIDSCVRCGGKLRILASIEEPEVIATILSHLQSTAPEQYSAELPLGARAGCAAISGRSCGPARTQRPSGKGCRR